MPDANITSDEPDLSMLWALVLRATVILEPWRPTRSGTRRLRSRHVGDLPENVAAASCFARLADERIETRHDRDRGVEIGIYSGLVSAHRPQVASVLEDRDQVSRASGVNACLVGRQCDIRPGSIVKPGCR